MLGRGDEARRLIDQALAEHPDDGLCLRTRGQIELLAGRAAEAEAPLRRAAALLPRDYQAQQLLFQALNQQGKTAEANEQLKVAEAVRVQGERLGALTSRKLGEAPLDPAPLYELGKLLIETGNGPTGEQWLLAALGLDPDHRPSHAALAAYYEGRGEAAKAAPHRTRLAAPKE
jgi:Flp pilus assembly protein TadD